MAGTGGMAAEEGLESMDIDRPRETQPPCSLCGKRKPLSATVAAVGLHVIRLLSKDMKDKVEALLEGRGLHLPEPGEEGANPLSISCSNRRSAPVAAQGRPEPAHVASTPRRQPVPGQEQVCQWQESASLRGTPRR